MGVIEEKFKWDGQLPRPSNMAFTYEDANTLSESYGGGGATLTVAASDAIHPERADYQCSGTADDVDIQLALDALGALAYGGTLYLTEGTYDITTTMKIYDYTVIQGAGTLATQLKLANNKNCNIFENENQAGVNRFITIQDLYLDGNKANQTTDGTLIDMRGANNLKIHKCRLWYAYNKGIYIEGGFQYDLNLLQISRAGNLGLHVYNGENGLYVSNSAIEVNGAGNLKIDNCPLSHIHHNYFDHSTGYNHIDIGNTSNVHISHNYLVNTSTSADVDNAIKVLDCHGVNIEDNYIRDSSATHAMNVGIYVGDSKYINILGNIVREAKKGIVLDEIVTHATDACNINNNLVVGVAGNNVLMIDAGIGNGACISNTFEWGDLYIYPSASFKISSNRFVNIGTFNIGTYARLRDCYGYKTEAVGVELFSGTGGSGTIWREIPHGLVRTPTYFNVSENSADAGTAEIFYISANATHIPVKFKTIPPTGTDNISLLWEARAY